MLSADVFTSFPGQMWEKVLSKVNKAVVFMDDPCAESLHWSGGAALLFGAGARNVKRFSSFESGAGNEPKAVFVVSTLLKGRTADIIKDIVSLSRFRYCVVLTAVPHSLHLHADGVSAELEGNVAFTHFEEKLCGWMGSAEYTAEVLHAPVHFARVSSQLLIAPAFADLFPLLHTDLSSINRKRPEKRRFPSLSDLDINSLPNELQVQIRALASGLNTLFELSNTREESFTVGPMSRLIAAELANHPQARTRRKSSTHKASVVFIDRTLDLTGAVGHHGDSLLEKILSVLPRLPGHVTDVQVDMLELTHLQRTPETQGVLTPGCLAQTHSAAAASLWETMLLAKQKEAVMEVRRQVVEAASKENLPIKMNLGVSSPEDLMTERAHTALERVFEVLRGLSRAREHLKLLRSVYSAGDGAHQATYRPFIKQVLEVIFSPNRPECPDIEHASGRLTDLLKTGFSMFMKVNRPHPSDHPFVFLVMVGGVTASELRLIRDIVSTHKAGTQVLVISTRLLRPADIPHLLFSTNRLSPDIGV
ncbi:Sec1 family domain-containing protein 2 [Bagarius yarrelli]|uniref:Sec1 family domain-containing protein 2 n=1 Tax=Bagarius yarrelli TaxID=175774 RepID=A0A556U6L7_BAGYA|nr:Sec1 family domain-containing protein 2 [Bagarius yarrelli]